MNPFIQDVDEYVSVLDEIITDLKRTRKNLADMNLGCLITRTTGVSVGIVATVLSIVGLVGAPVTAGASLGLTVAGIATGVASGATGVGTAVVKHFNTKAFLQKIMDLQDRVNEAGEILLSKLPKVGQYLHPAEDLNKDSIATEEITPTASSKVTTDNEIVEGKPAKSSQGNTLATANSIAMKLGRGVSSGTKLVLDSTGTMKNALQAAGGVFVALGVIFSAWDVVDVTKEWWKRNPTVEDIECFLESLQNKRDLAIKIAVGEIDIEMLT